MTIFAQSQESWFYKYCFQDYLGYFHSSPTLSQLLCNCIPRENDYEGATWSKCLYKQMNQVKKFVADIVDFAKL